MIVNTEQGFKWGNFVSPSSMAPHYKIYSATYGYLSNKISAFCFQKVANISAVPVCPAYLIASYSSENVI